MNLFQAILTDDSWGKKVHLWPVAAVDEAMEILTGYTSGERDASDNYPAGSLNLMVEARLAQLAEVRKEFARTRPPSHASSTRL